MGDRVGIRALQQNASAVVSRAAAGEIVEITDRGRPIAQLGPVVENRLAALVAAGIARPAKRRLRGLPAPVPRRGRRSSLGQLLAEARDAER